MSGVKMIKCNCGEEHIEEEEDFTSGWLIDEGNCCFLEEDLELLEREVFYDSEGR